MKPFLFDTSSAVTDEQLMAEFAAHTLKALEHLVGMMPTLDLHDRLAIVVPDDAFRAGLQSRLESALMIKGRKFKYVRAGVTTQRP